MNRFWPFLFLVVVLNSCTSTSVMTPLTHEMEISPNESIYVDNLALGKCLEDALEDEFEVSVHYPYKNGVSAKPDRDFRYEIHAEFQDSSKSFKDYKGLGSDPDFHAGEGGFWTCVWGCWGLGMFSREKIVDAHITNTGDTNAQYANLNNWGNGGTDQTIIVKADGEIVVVGFILPIPIYIPFTGKAVCNTTAEEIAKHLKLNESTKSEDTPE